MIRKIVIGRDPKDAMAYYIGMRAGTGKVSAILLDEQHLHKYGSKKYLIYIENEEGTMVWKAVDGMPCIVEYDLKFD
tara:strand:- start:5544 stop:5774 length:231 start_codon:yes stop_codon:yes gene_type:complete